MPVEVPVLRTADDLTAARLEAPDGRISQFPRAMCAVHDREGRDGVAWVEWNRNRSLA